MDVPAHCQDNQTMTKARMTIKMLWYFQTTSSYATHLEWIEDEGPKCLFQIDDMTKEHLIYKQEVAMLKPWVDPHCLKKINNTWSKDGR